MSKSSIDEIIIGQSAPAKDLKKLIEVVAKAPTSVLVLGETGTGKELSHAPFILPQSVMVGSYR